MALTRGRGGQRFSTNIWPGFVDAMTALLMVLMFVLTIFMIVQFTLRETISTQDDELAALSQQVAGLAEALGLERDRSAQLGRDVNRLNASLEAASREAERQSALIATLRGEISDREAALAAASARISDFEAQVALLLSERDAAQAQAAQLSAERDRLLSTREALNLAIAKARSEIDAQAEAARLDAARRAALEALIADLRKRDATQAARLGEVEAALAQKAEALDAAEAARLAEAAAAQALREKLKGAEDELTAMTLALEQERRKAEETLTMLAAAEAARKDLDVRLAEALLARSASQEELDRLRAEVAKSTQQEARSRAALEAGKAEVERRLAAALADKLAAESARSEALDEAERQRLLMQSARAALAQEKEVSAEAQRKVALLNQQIAALRTQLGSLQAMLDVSAAKDAEAKVQIEALGTQLNSALARVAAEERRRRELEEAERRRLEAEAAALKAETQELSRYRSEFFARLSKVLEGREGVRVVGDRFVFSSEVLFEPASADLSPEGRSQIARVVATLKEVAAEIPDGIDWIVRVDGHTDKTPLSGSGRFRDNWELSVGRALSVVRFMHDELGFPADRLAATGFGEYHPVAEGDSPEALAQNRRIELKLTER
ncbi:peptidoglycan -binding protein [Albidovulum sp.]